MLGVLALAAHAGVTFTREPLQVEKDDPGSMPSKTADVRDWRIKMGDRGTLAALDKGLGWRSDAVEACLRARGTPAATAEIKVSLERDGTATAKKASGDDAVAACVAEGLARPFLLVVLRSVSVTIQVAWDPTTPAVPPPAALMVDREKGFGVFDWGASASGAEGMSYDMAERGTTFMARTGEYMASILGSKTTGARYAFGEDGLHSVVISVEGSTDAYRVREALTALYGPSKWDTGFSSYYWRGEKNLLLYRVAGANEVVVTLMDMERARASGLADRMPGDKASSTIAGGRRLPKTYSTPTDAPAEPEKAQEEAAPSP